MTNIDQLLKPFGKTSKEISFILHHENVSKNMSSLIYIIAISNNYSNIYDFFKEDNILIHNMIFNYINSLETNKPLGLTKDEIIVNIFFSIQIYKQHNSIQY